MTSKTESSLSKALSEMAACPQLPPDVAKSIHEAFDELIAKLQIAETRVAQLEHAFGSFVGADSGTVEADPEQSLRSPPVSENCGVFTLFGGSDIGEASPMERRIAASLLRPSLTWAEVDKFMDERREEAEKRTAKLLDELRARLTEDDKRVLRQMSEELHPSLGGVGTEFAYLPNSVEELDTLLRLEEEGCVSHVNGRRERCPWHDAPSDGSDPCRSHHLTEWNFQPWGLRALKECME